MFKRLSVKICGFVKRCLIDFQKISLNIYVVSHFSSTLYAHPLLFKQPEVVLWLGRPNDTTVGIVSGCDNLFILIVLSVKYFLLWKYYLILIQIQIKRWGNIRKKTLHNQISKWFKTFAKIGDRTASSMSETHAAYRYFSSFFLTSITYN